MNMSTNIDYLSHWWIGDVGQYYRILSFEVAQVNKICKIGLYAIGLTALFDIIEFKKVVYTVRGVSETITVINYVFNKLILGIDLAYKMLLALGYYLTRYIEPPRMQFSEIMDKIMKSHINETMNNAYKVASRKWYNVLLLWLEQHPPTALQIKSFAFTLFVILAAMEILTS